MMMMMRLEWRGHHVETLELAPNLVGICGTPTLLSSELGTYKPVKARCCGVGLSHFQCESLENNFSVPQVRRGVVSVALQGIGAIGALRQRAPTVKWTSRRL